MRRVTCKASAGVATAESRLKKVADSGEKIFEKVSIFGAVSLGSFGELRYCLITKSSKGNRPKGVKNGKDSKKRRQRTG